MSAPEGGSIFGHVGTNATTNSDGDVVVKTTNMELQSALVLWTQMLDVVQGLPVGSSARREALIDFVRHFAPGDCEEGDIIAFAEQLASDTEFFTSMNRELHQCESGQCVESISGNQSDSAVYTLKPLPGQLSEGGAALDIVREVSFVADLAAGGNWRAEG